MAQAVGAFVLLHIVTSCGNQTTVFVIQFIPWQATKQAYNPKGNIMLMLNQSQAMAVYNAMCELNNINAVINVTIKPPYGGSDPAIKVIESPIDGHIVVSQYEREVYKTQDAFKVAYRIQD